MPDDWHKSRLFVMFVLLFCRFSEQCSQTNFPIIKDKAFQGNKIHKEWRIFRPKWAKIKNLCHYFIFVIKNKDTHYKYTYK